MSRRFRFVRELGGGASGEVFLVEDRFRGGARLALKRLRDATSSAAARERLEVLALRHPNLVRTLDVELQTKPPYLTQAFVEGPNLALWSAEHSAAEILVALGGIVRALCLLHDRGWVHGDLKPQNILVDTDDVPKLIDLDMAVRIGQPAGGTIGYAAPELMVDGWASARSDIYSLSVVACELLSGERLFGVDRQMLDRQSSGWLPTLEHLDLAPEIVALLLRCLAADPEQRPAASELLAALSIDEEAARRTPPALPLLCGRDRELQVAEQALRAAADGQGATALIVAGAEGLGKSRLLKELHYRAIQLGFHCVRESTLRRTLDQLGAERRGPSIAREAAQRQEHHEHKPQLSGENEDELLTLPLATRLRDALFSAATAAARRRPTLLLCDDVGLREPVERQAIDGLVQALIEPDEETASLPLVCIVATAPPVPEQLAAARCLSLRPLEPAQSQRALASMLPGLRVSAATLERLAAMASGIPWLLVEALLLWQRHGEASWKQLQRTDRLLIAKQRLPDAGVSRACIELVASAPELDSRAVYQLVPALDANVVQSLVAAQLIIERSDGQRLMLSLLGEHLRQCVEQQLSKEQQRERHEQLAAVLDELGAPPQEVAFHHEQAGATREAAAQYLAAARRGGVQASRWAARALELGAERWEKRHEALRAAATAAASSGEIQQAARHLEQLDSEGGADDGDRLKLARLYVALGQPDQAARILGGQSGDEAQLVRARASLQRGALDEVAKACASLTDSGELLNLRGLVEHARGDLTSATASLQQAAELFAERGDLAGQSKVSINLAIVCQARGDLEGAARWYRRGEQQAEALGDPLRVVQCQLNHGTVNQLRGKLGGALADYQRARFDARRLGSQQLETQATLNLSSLRLELGDWSGAEQELERLPAEALAPTQTVYALLNGAESAAGRLDMVAAERLVAQARETAVVSGDSTAEIEVLLAEARLALQQGQLEQAVELGFEAARRAEALGFDKLSDEGRFVAGRASRRLPRHSPGQDRALIEPLVGRMQRRGELGRVWLAHYELSQIEALDGNAIEGAFHLAKARQGVDQLLETQHPGLQDTILARPDFREVYCATRRLGEPAVALLPDAAAPGGNAADPLLALNLELARVRDPGELIELILDKAIELTAAQRGLVILVDNDALQVAAARNIDRQTLAEGTEQFSKNLAREVLATGSSTVTVDALHDERYQRFESVHALKLRSVLCAPLKIWGSIAGVIYLDNRFRPHAFTRQQLSLVEGFGAQAGLALDAARRIASERQKVEQLEAAKAQIEQLTDQLQRTIARQSAELEQSNALLAAQRQQLGGSSGVRIVGESPAIRAVLELIAKTAHVEIPIYIYGESGTGKELVARLVHQRSPRAEQPLVTINCGGLSTELLASELFGHVKGAFTGASRNHAGLIQTADGGTLFLDEVTEMSPEVQVQLLRVLQSGEYRAVGSDQLQRADIRIISAGNLDLDEAVRQGRFREDLSYRLNVIRFDLPPLRERAEDIPLLVRHFLGDKPVDKAAIRLLMSHRWPGNVRELANELARASALATGRTVSADDLSPRLLQGKSVPLAGHRAADAPASHPLADTLARAERQAVIAALGQTGFKPTEAARLLGISRASLYNKMRRHGIHRKSG